MRKNFGLLIITIILSSFIFKQIVYCHETSIEKSESITINYEIDPPFPDSDSKPR